MTQVQVDLYKKRIQTLDASIQTNEKKEVFLYFSNNKSGRLYYSTVFREYVLALNISASKSFIMNKNVWNQFKKSIYLIDNFFEQNE
jgi:hypothetical protein